ncbi:mannan endo-1,4-beta-mannosidase 6-like [Triticum dicoccoides]|uniref:mannan endo-1,4-beta-mannosidase 6-like n=1 Tax=Triticum dicoccoides TaxID=85692 RepID=UPI0018917CEE|nr:mannan endo-1,4-beta-mannosidase 6-like [Triticum dicoccoides]XP_044426817.1 mannan endo-1,4-beta-mannosidase 6-like isoform X2 [Triticum aestivum]
MRREKRLYSFLGLLLLLAVVYLNWLPGRDPAAPGGGGLKLPVPWLQPRMSFAGRNGTHFVDADTGAPLYVNGWNSYWLLSSRSPALVSEMLRRGRRMGLGVCRTWAFIDGGPGALQISPGRFNEAVFQVLDYIIYEARRNHIRLILCLVNNLDNFGGKAQYVKWAQAAGANLTNSTDSFFYDPTVKGYYKDYVKAILTRRNSYSGIRYSDEPAIFAWELMNEPRCVSNSSGPHLQAWIAEMAAYVKSLDAKHLVAVGIEGFYGTGIAERLGFNPGDWAASLCSDFIQNSAVENIDFASVHAYPDSWLPKASMEEKLRYLSSWVDSHLNDSEHILKKPVLFSEVGYLQHVEGNSTVDRDILLRVVYDKIYDSARKLQAGGGALIWQLMVEGTHMYHDDFSLVARDHPSTYKLITEQSCRLQMLYENDRDPDWQCAIQP